MVVENYLQFDDLNINEQNSGIERNRQQNTQIINTILSYNNKNIL